MDALTVQTSACQIPEDLREGRAAEVTAAIAGAIVRHLGGAVVFPEEVERQQPGRLVMRYDPGHRMVRVSFEPA